MLKSKLPLLVIFLGASSTAYAQGPFGVNTQGSPHDYDCIASQQPNWFECLKMPRRHPDLARYFVKYFEGVGFCTIQGHTESFVTDPEGNTARQRVIELESQIQERYEVHGQRLNLPPTADQRNFMLEIAQDGKVWGRRFVNISDEEIDQIHVGLKAHSYAEGYIIVEFSLQKDECAIKEQEIEKEKEREAQERRREGIESF